MSETFSIIFFFIHIYLLLFCCICVVGSFFLEKIKERNARKSAKR